MNIRASVFAAWRVAWLCVACWIASHVIGRVVGASVVSVCTREVGRRTLREHVFADFDSDSASVKFPDPKAEEGAGGRESDFASPVSLLRYLGARRVRACRGTK